MDHPGAITLTTDFGLLDNYVGVMKGVILGIAAECHVIDLTHAIPPFDVVQAAFRIADVVPYFPQGTIHVCVVDPGVGGDRRVVAMVSEGQIFLAPDNGLLDIVRRRYGFDDLVEVTERDYMLPDISPTFHGRDIFAPVAARLALGARVKMLGLPLERLLPLDIADPVAEDGKMIGQVLWHDRFGNLVTDIRAEAAEATLGDLLTTTVAVGERGGIRFVETYEQGVDGELIALVGSFGAIEISMPQRSAATALGAARGTPVIISGA